MASVLKKTEKSSRLQENSAESSHRSFEVLLRALAAYEEIDSASFQRSEKPDTSELRNRRLTWISNRQAVLDLTSANRGFVYYLLNLSGDEFYGCYNGFFKQFDRDNSLIIEENDFYVMLEYLGRPEQLGKTKLKASFKCLDQIQYDVYHKKLSRNSTEIEYHLKRGMFGAVSSTLVRESTIVQKECVNYLKFLPMMMSYFGDFVRRRVSLRAANLDLICGLDSELEESPCNINSLYTKLKSLGIILKKGLGHPKIAFKDLEKAIILFRNSYSETFTPEQLRLVIEEVRTKLKINSKDANTDKHIIVLDYELLRWVSYRLCLHCALFNLMKNNKKNGIEAAQVPKHQILEEYTLWACAYNLKSFQARELKAKFSKYAKKHIKIDHKIHPRTPEHKDIMKNHFMCFIRKIFPHMSTVSINSLLTTFEGRHFQSDNELSYQTQLAGSLEALLIHEATDKLMDIINAIHKAALSHDSIRKIIGQESSSSSKASLGNSLPSSCTRSHSRRRVDSTKGRPDQQLLLLDKVRSYQSEGAYLDSSKEITSLTFERNFSEPIFSKRKVESALFQRRHTKRDLYDEEKPDTDGSLGSESSKIPTLSLIDSIKNKKYRDRLIRESIFEESEEKEEKDKPIGSRSSLSPALSKPSVFNRKTSEQTLESNLNSPLLPLEKIVKINERHARSLSEKFSYFPYSGLSSQGSLIDTPTSKQVIDSGSSLDSETKRSVRFQKNESTGRLPDILNSLFILEGFLETYSQKGSSRRKQSPKRSSGPSKTARSKVSGSTPRLSDPFRREEANAREIFDITEQTEIFVEESFGKKYRDKDSEQSPIKFGEFKLNNELSESKPNTRKLDPQKKMRISSANLKLADSFVSQSKSSSRKKPAFNFKIDEYDDDMNMDDIKFSPDKKGGTRTNHRLYSGDEKRICGLGQTFVCYKSMKKKLKTRETACSYSQCSIF